MTERLSPVVIRLLGAFVLFLLVCRASAQLPGIALTHYTSDDGLPHDFVRALAFDRAGFLWIGTHDGLARFDGRRFQVYRHLDDRPNSLPDNVVTGLSCDLSGRIWASMETGGLAWCEAGVGAFHPIPLQMPGSTEPYRGFVSPLAVGPDGMAWFGTLRFLGRLNLQTLAVEYFPFPEGHQGQNTPFVDSRGRVWLALDGSTFRFDPQQAQFQYYLGRRDTDPAKTTLAGALCEDDAGKLWMCSWDRGLFFFDEAVGEFRDFPDGQIRCTEALFDVLPGQVPVVWAAGGDHGFYIMDRRDGAQYQFPRQPLEKYAHNGARAYRLLRDSLSGIVWIATEAGLEKYDPHDLKFARVWLPEAVQYNQFCSISGIVQDPHDPDRYWISVWGVGLYEWRRKGNTFRRFAEGKGIHNSIIPSRRGALWLSEMEGLEELDPYTGRVLRQFRNFLPAGGGRNYKILSVLEGRDGRLWIGANYDALFVLDPSSGRLDSIPMPAGQKISAFSGIFSLQEGAMGQVYASTANGLFRCLRGARQAQLIQSGFFGNMTLDAQQRLWVSTRSGALCFDEADQLIDSVNSRNTGGFMQNNSVYQLTTDGDGNLWIGTANGLYRFDPVSRALKKFGKKDGLFGNEIYGVLQALPDGHLCVGFNYNFNLLNPREVPVNPHPPVPILAGLKIANRDAPWQLGLPVVLRPGENVVSFDFSAINFTQPGETVLLYRLMGFEENWVETPLGAPLTYTNLDGGEYVLQVKARNADGVESAEPFEVRLRVIPPFYKTWWFRLLIVLLLAGIVIFVLWYREQERRRLEGIRRRIARDLHDDMGSTLSSIRFFSEVAQNRLTAGEPEASHPLLQRIADSAGVLSEAMRDIVWAIGGRNDRLEDLVTRMREFGLKICETRNIVFHTDLPDPLPQTTLRPDRLRNLYLVFKEAINNAAKYAECSEIILRLRFRRGFLTLEVADNGRGFDPQVALQGEGNGLPNLYQRAAEIDGKLSLDSAPGKGTRVTLTAPLR